MNVRKVGEYIRHQRTGSKLSLRKLSSLAGVSIPYLSQVERGLRKPSADILQAIAKALRISAEQIYIQAGMLEERPASDVTTSIMADHSITATQKRALIQIYQAFRDEAGRDRAARRARKKKTTETTSVTVPIGSNGARRRPAGSAASSSPRPVPAKTSAVHRASTRGTSMISVRRPGGGAASQAGSNPLPAPTRSPATHSTTRNRKGV
jgi:transcriptional regulator with XRE-family HTH domain